MYLYNDEQEEYTFEGDLKAYLLKYGISAEHIENMQHKILENNDREKYYKIDNQTRDERLVPLDKVIGISRGTVESSVYENVRKIKKGEREPAKFKDCLHFLEIMTLEKLRQSYEEDIEPVKMNHYVEEDVYYLPSDGNHRTLTAMLIGADYIRANVLEMGCDIELRDKFISYKSFTEDYKIKEIYKSGGSYNIIFSDDRGIYKICKYPVPEKDDTFSSYVTRLAEMIDEDIQKAGRIENMPEFFRKHILNCKQNYRIKQYVEKQYIEEELASQTIDERIELYKVL